MTLYLTGQVGDQQQTWPLDGDLKTVGRSSRNAIHLPDATVSKEHAEFSRNGDRWFVRDLGSRNGTRLNGNEVKEPVPIEATDRVEIGHVLLRVTGEAPRLEVKLNDATVLGSSIKIRADRILERSGSTAKSSGPMVHLLAEAGRLLVLPRPLDQTCDELLSFVEKAVKASRYVLLMRQDAGQEPVQIAARTTAGRSSQPLALSRSIMNMVMDECTSVLTADASLDPRFQGQQSIVAQSVHSAMAVPLFDNERVLGLLYVDSQDFRTTFGEEQLELLTLLANMAAVKITNARLLEAEQARARMVQELSTATHIQRGMLPAAVPVIPGWSFEALLQTCYEVGGDLYDFYVRQDGRLVFVVGDVTGKGMGAALLMSSFLASARVLYDASPDPVELATRLGAIIYRSTDPIHYVTGFVGWLDPATGELEYVNAAHPAGIVARGGELRELESTCAAFGMLPDFPYAKAVTRLAPGETLAIYSDGIPEAMRGEDFFGAERLNELMRKGGENPKLDELRRAIVTDVDQFLAGAPRTDDVTLLLLRREA